MFANSFVGLSFKKHPQGIFFGVALDINGSFSVDSIYRIFLDHYVRIQLEIVLVLGNSWK